MATTVKMRVICPSCGARYRVDPARFKGRVGRIKCSKCEHQFPVRVPQPSQDTASLYSIKRAATDDEIAAPSLDTVKRLIIEGKVGGDDLLSKPGKSPKRIGDIAQLQPFLRVRQHSGIHPVPDLSPTDDVGEQEAERAEDTQDLVQALPDDGRPSVDAEAAEEGDEEGDEEAPIQPDDDGDGDGDGESYVSDDDDVDDAMASDDMAESNEEEDEPDRADREDEADEDDAASEPAEESFATAVTPIDEDDLRPQSVATGRRVGLYLLLFLLLAAIALAAVYVAAPETFDALLP